MFLGKITLTWSALTVDKLLVTPQVTLLLGMSIKGWEVKDWGESVSELVIGKKNNNKKLYTVLSYLGVFTFRTRCKILICIVCIFASFMLSCV